MSGGYSDIPWRRRPCHAPFTTAARKHRSAGLLASRGGGGLRPRTVACCWALLPALLATAPSNKKTLGGLCPPNLRAEVESSIREHSSGGWLPLARPIGSAAAYEVRSKYSIGGSSQRSVWAGDRMPISVTQRALGVIA